MVIPAKFPQNLIFSALSAQHHQLRLREVNCRQRQAAGMSSSAETRQMNMSIGIELGGFFHLQAHG